MACGNKQAAAVRLLLEYGADVNLPLKVRVKILLTLNFEQFFYLYMQDPSGKTALFCACVYGCVDIARLLLDHGAMVDYQNLVTWSSY